MVGMLTYAWVWLLKRRLWRGVILCIILMMLIKIQNIHCYQIRGLWSSFSLPLLLFDQIILWWALLTRSRILRWALRPMERPLERPLENLLLQNHWANFNQTWHKASLGEGDSSMFKWRAPPFSKERWKTLTKLKHLLLQNIYNHMCLLIWTVFSGERCGPWASCSMVIFMS